MGRIKITIALILTTSLMLFAQTANEENQDTQENQISAQTNEIFNDIMQSMSEEMKEKVDSASNINKENALQNQGTDSQNQKALQEQKRTKAINELPEDIRERVQKRIQEIENKNEERALQFKEQMKKKDQ